MQNFAKKIVQKIVEKLEKLPIPYFLYNFSDIFIFIKSKRTEKIALTDKKLLKVTNRCEILVTLSLVV